MTTDVVKKGWRDEPTATLALLSSVIFFAITALVGIFMATKFLLPEFMGNVPFLTFGRMRPLHTNGVLFGWLLLADMGLIYHVIPKLGGNKLWSEKLGLFTVILYDLVVLGAVYALPAGDNQGLEYAEMPLWLDVPVIVCWVLFGLNIFATVATRKHQKIYVASWYMMGGIIWTAFTYLTGNIAVEFFTGINQANLNWFWVHNAVGLIFTPLGLGVAYYFIPKASQAPLFSHKLSMVGFWSIAFIYVWTGAHHMLHGPISQWLQTVSILFSAMLIIPVWTVVFNFFATVSGKWDRVRQDPILKYLMAGTTFYVLTCFQGPMHSLRTVSAIVSKTDWVVGHAHMAVLGAFSFFAIAGTLYSVPRILGRELYSVKLANTGFWLMFTGALVFFAVLWVGGFLQGLQWNDPSIPWIDTVKFMKPFWAVRLTGGIFLYAGIFLVFYNVLRTFTASSVTQVQPVVPAVRS
jgi:cytochrome c oxidase cbb3-type subunit 1